MVVSRVVCGGWRLRSLVLVADHLATSTVVEGVTGVFFEELSVGSLKGAIERFEGMEFDRKKCVERAGEFSRERFEREMKKVITQLTG